jgi:PAS domain-containing protein
LDNAEDDMRKRDRILAGAALATNQLLTTNDSDLALNQALEILCIGNDPTENERSSERLKRVVQDLRETRNYLESPFDHANALMIVWSPSFRITRFNRAFERLTPVTGPKMYLESIWIFSFPR